MNKPPSISFGQWQHIKLLGAGTFGEVHHWINHESGCEIAVKRLKANPKLKPDEVSILHKRWSQEYKWIKNLRTNYFVGAVQIDDLNFLKYLAEQNRSDPSLPVIIMEYCNGGDLRGQLNKLTNLNGLIEYEVCNVLYSLIRATEYLHQECNIEHRDIKPENIVLHIKGNQKLYKLTDFGYAKEIPESTIAQSVVGTRHYVAPEVIDPGIYTRTVDYWSIGVLAYEIMCGIHPFIPHQSFVNRMRNIQQKPSQCIAIVEKMDDLTGDNFEFINNLQPQNHLSPKFVKAMEEWLRLALDSNYKTRGYNDQGELKFYSDLDAILQVKVCTVFSLKTFQKYYYDIEAFKSLSSFYNKICSDNEIDIRDIFFIFPPLHPKKYVRNAIDYYVPEWCDTSNTDNPPVMLFVTEYLIQTRCDINVEENFTTTEAIRKCMCMSGEKDDVPQWILRQFERDVHYTLAKHQHLLECYMMGLHNFIIDVEHAVFNYKSNIDELSKRSSQLKGRVLHFNVVVDEYVKTENKEAGYSAKENAEMFAKKSRELANNILPQLKATYKDILQKCRLLATNKIYETYPKNDIFGLSKFRKLLSLSCTTAQRLENAQIFFEKCINQFIKFTQSSELNDIRGSIREAIQKFNSICQSVIDLNEMIFQLENELEALTRSLIRNIINDKISSSINSLHFDGTTLTPVSLINNHCSLDNLNVDSQLLIDECQTLCEAMEMSLDIN